MLAVIKRQPVFATNVALQNSTSYRNLTTYGNHRNRNRRRPELASDVDGITTEWLQLDRAKPTRK
jgi:hypothetical protein